MANRHSRGQHNGIQIRLRHPEPLSNRGIESTRIAALTVLEQATHPGPLQVFSTHIARGDECQMERVGQIVRDGLGAGPTLLIGDFNTPETSKVLTTLRNEAGFVDASGSPKGPTVWQEIEVEQSTVSRRRFYVNGREKWERCDTKSQAKALYGHRKAEQREGKYFEKPQVIQFRHLALEYVKTLEARQRRKGDDKFQNKRWLAAFGDQDMNNITIRQIEKVLTGLQADGLGQGDWEM